MNKVNFDAFISYKHCEIDSFIAENIHKMLEHYIVPKKVQENTGKKKIHRVFRDMEELSLSSDLSEKIQYALAHTEYLVVICSKESIQSRWVHLELETFLKSHDKDHVLIVVVGNDPAGIVPEVLLTKKETVTLSDGRKETITRMVEPRMAMITGQNEKEILKNLKEEKLRIVAPILGCSYEDLRQRDQEYRYKRKIRIAGIISLFLATFLSVSFYQYRQIQKQYTVANENQEKYMVSVSRNLLKLGNLEGALKVALAVEANDTDQAIIPEQMGILNTALHSYIHDNSLQYDAVKQISLDNDFSSGSLSPDGSTFLCIDSYGNVNLIDCHKKEVFWKFCADDYDNMGIANFSAGEIIDDQTAVIASTDTILAINYKKKTILWSSIYSQSFYSGLSIKMTCSKNRSALTIGSYLFLYDNNNGVCLYEYKYDDTDDLKYISNQIALSPSEQKIAIGLSHSSYKNTSQGVLLMDQEKNTVEFLDVGNTIGLAFCGDDDSLVMIGQSYIDESQNFSYYNNNDYQVEIYDLKERKVLQKSEIIHKADTSQRFYGISELEGYKMVYVLNTYYVIDSKKHKIIFTQNVSQKISHADFYDTDHVLLSLSDGSIKIISYNTDSITINNPLSIGGIDKNVSHVFYNRTYNQFIYVDKELTILSEFQDDQWIDLHWEHKVQDVKWYQDSKGQSYRYMLLHDYFSDDKKDMILVYKTGEDQPLLSLQAEEGTEYEDVMLGEKDGQVICYYITKISGEDYNQNYNLFQYSLASEQAESLLPNSAEKNESIDNIIFSKDGKYALLIDSSTFSYARICLSDETSQISWKSFEHRSYSSFINITNYNLSKDGKYMIMTCLSINSVHDKRALLCFNLDQEEYVDFSGISGLRIADDDTYTISDNNQTIAYYNANKKLEIADMKTGETTMSISLGTYDSIALSFIQDDRYLLVLTDKKELSVFDTKTGSKTMSEKIENLVDGLNASQIRVDPTGQYFTLNQTGYLTDAYRNQTIPHSAIFYFDENGSFGLWAQNTRKIYADFHSGEIINEGDGSIGYFSIYSFTQLREKARSLVGDLTLTADEKRRYSLSE